MWTKAAKLFLLLTMIAMTIGCKMESIDEDLSTYVKPVLTSINPAGVIYSEVGFTLTVFSEYFENDAYVLYVNDQYIGKGTPNYWHYKISWNIPDSVVQRSATAAGNGETELSIRLTPIQTDISDNFGKYSEYISATWKLKIKRNPTVFSDAQRLFPLWENSADAVLRVDNQGTLYLAWREKVNDLFQAFFCFSQDNGDTWSQVLNISRSTGNVTYIDMDIDGNGNFFLIYSEEEAELSSVFFCKSLDNGATWFFPTQLSSPGINGERPILDIDPSGRLYMAWTESNDDSSAQGKIWFASSTDNWTGNWTTKVIAQGELYQMGDAAMKTDDSGHIHLIWGYDYQIFHTVSTDSGESWIHYPTTIEGNFFKSWNTSLHIDNNRMYLIWNTEDYLGHNYNNWIHFATGPLDGSAWSDEQLMDNQCNSSSKYSSIWTAGDNVDLLMSNNTAVFLLRSTDQGNTWSYPQFIKATRSDELYSKPLTMVENEAGQMFIVFIKKTDSLQETGTLYLTRSN